MAAAARLKVTREVKAATKDHILEDSILSGDPLVK